MLTEAETILFFVGLGISFIAGFAWGGVCTMQSVIKIYERRFAEHEKNTTLLKHTDKWIGYLDNFSRRED